MLKPTRTMLFFLMTAALLLLSACSLLPASPPIKDFTWRWQNWQTPQDVRPTQVYNPDRYTLTLNADRTVSVQAVVGAPLPSTSTKHRRHEANGGSAPLMAHRLGM